MFMTLRDVKDILSAQVLVGEEKLDQEAKTAFAADLLSDVLAYAKEGSLLLTLITNPQVVRTVELLDLVEIVFVRGKKPPKEPVELARKKENPLLLTDYILF